MAEAQWSHEAPSSRHVKTHDLKLPNVFWKPCNHPSTPKQHHAAPHAGQATCLRKAHRAHSDHGPVLCHVHTDSMVFHATGSPPPPPSFPASEGKASDCQLPLRVVRVEPRQSHSSELLRPPVCQIAKGGVPVQEVCRFWNRGGPYVILTLELVNHFFFVACNENSSQTLSRCQWTK